MKKLLLLLLFAPSIVLGQIPDPKPGTYVNNAANVLTQGDIARLNEQIYALEKKYSVQLAIVLINELPVNYAIEDYAREIGRKWHVGNARNGLVYVAAINQRKQRLEVAANLEGSIPDIEALRLTDHIKPYFRNKDYAGGLSNLVKEIDELLNPVVKEQKALAEAELKKKEESFFDTAMLFLIVILGTGGIGFVIYYILLRRSKKNTQTEPQIKPTYSTAAFSSTKSSNYIAPIYIDNSTSNYDSGYSSRRSYDSDSGSSSSSSSSSSDYGNWGSGSSDSSSSSDSGYSGGGSSNDW